MKCVQKFWILFAAKLLSGSELNRMVQGGNDRSVIHHCHRVYILGDKLTENVNRRHQLPKRRPFATVLSNLYPQSDKYYLSLSLSMDPSKKKSNPFIPCILVLYAFPLFFLSFFFYSDVIWNLNVVFNILWGRLECIYCVKQLWWIYIYIYMKNLVTSYTRLACIVDSGEVRGEVGVV